MEELIAKRYINALKKTMDAGALENASELFTALAAAFSDAKFQAVICNPDVSDTDKTSLLLEAVKSAQSDLINNLIRLLVEHGRVEIIPAIAKGLKKEIAALKQSYTGVVFSNTQIDAATLEGLSSGLGKKVNASIALEFVQNDYDGVKVEVQDLGVEINFSKSRLNSQLVEHILKAI